MIQCLITPVMDILLYFLFNVQSQDGDMFRRVSRSLVFLSAQCLSGWFWIFYPGSWWEHPNLNVIFKSPMSIFPTKTLSGFSRFFEDELGKTQDHISLCVQAVDVYQSSCALPQNFLLASLWKNQDTRGSQRTDGIMESPHLPKQWQRQRGKVQNALQK